VYDADAVAGAILASVLFEYEVTVWFVRFKPPAPVTAAVHGVNAEPV
jgi:hypothetical protein